MGERFYLQQRKRKHTTGYARKEAGEAARVQGITIDGAGAMAEILQDLAPKYARNLIRTVNYTIAVELKNRIKAATPSNTGNLKKSLKAKRRKSPPENPISEVIFESGKGMKHDGYYWRFVEHGTAKGKKGSSGQAARPFVGPTKEQFMPEIAGMVNEIFVKKLVAMVNREKKKKAIKV